MGDIDEVREDREALSQVLRKHSGIRKLVEKLYPDSAHFIYELLQNAEDTGAGSTLFTLTREGLWFQHNGRPFTRQDLEGITDIGEGTKEDDEEKIGRFGVGFKAVFTYTNSPHIWSPTYCFKIENLVLPMELPSVEDLGGSTRFWFPFDSPKKPLREAYSEVHKALNNLADTSLLFLNSIRCINWEADDLRGEIRRSGEEAHHVCISVRTETDEAVHHYLKFEESRENLQRPPAAIAFELESLPDAEKKASSPFCDRFKIVPADFGLVAVYFPADRETSGLRFHLHAPFVPELSRASIVDDAKNINLFKHLAQLTARSLHEIRRMGMLTVEFLACLPNHDDRLDSRYAAIRELILHEMTWKALTPTLSRSHAPAHCLVQGKAELKGLFSEEDLPLFIAHEDMTPMWVMSAPLKNGNSDRFLQSLDIQEWQLEDFVDGLADGLRGQSAQVFQEWLSSKSPEWLQRLYALFFAERETLPNFCRLDNLAIVRLRNGDFELGRKCCFPTPSTRDLPLLWVDEAVYSSGKNKGQQARAQGFLEEVGVHEASEQDVLKNILEHRYTKEADIPPKEIYERDFKYFMQVTASNPSIANLFRDYFVFQGEDGSWYPPESIYIDEPYQKTRVRILMQRLDSHATHVALSPRYGRLKIPNKDIVSFVKGCGAKASIEEGDFLPLTNATECARDEGLADEEAIELLWRSLVSLGNQHIHLLEELWRGRYSPSDLCNKLRTLAWIPQQFKGGTSYVAPPDADCALLPPGFTFDAGWRWISLLGFGETLEECRRKEQEAARTQDHLRRQREATAREIGFSSADELDLWAELARQGVKPQEVKALLVRPDSPEFPARQVSNEAQRRSRVRLQVQSSPRREYAHRNRSVRISNPAERPDIEVYLREQYTNSNKQLICQICRQEMPFKRRDGKYYFERVEAFSLERELIWNHLALCPLCAAKYTEFIVRNPKERQRFQSDFLQSDSLAFTLPLGGRLAESIQFVHAHRLDLRVTLEELVTTT